VRTFLEHRFDGTEDRVVRFVLDALTLAEEVEHHRRGPDHRHRVRDVFTGNIRRGPMHRFE
jgi:hypothetical protein